MDGDRQGGFTIFYADDGLDTGPILLQKSIDIEPNETVDTLYNRFLYPEGIKGMVSLGFYSGCIMGCLESFLFRFNVFSDGVHSLKSYSSCCCLGDLDERFGFNVLSFILFIIVLNIQVEAVNLIADGKASKTVQPEEGATYDKIWKKKEVAQVGY